MGNSECFFAGCISISDGFIQDFTFKTNGSIFFLYIYIYTLSKQTCSLPGSFFLNQQVTSPWLQFLHFFSDPRYHLRRRTRERCPPPGKSRRGGWEPPASGPSVPQTARQKWANKHTIYIYISIVYIYISVSMYKYTCTTYV